MRSNLIYLMQLFFVFLLTIKLKFSGFVNPEQAILQKFSKSPQIAKGFCIE